MKKLFALLLVALLAFSGLAGCAGSKSVKTGLGIVTTISGSKDATATAAGLGQGYSIVAAVTVGSDGKIVNCVIDAIQSKVNFDATGKITSDIKAEVKTKNELGEAYGMKKASGIGKEWNEQAAAFAAYVKGKTIAEVKAIALDAEGHPTAADLKASVTVHVNDLIVAIDKAVANAQELGAKAGDKLGLGTTTSLSGSKSATAEAAGLAQAYSYYTVTTFDSNNKVTSCIIDATIAKINFSAAGVVTSDKTAETKTKNELGAAYGMKKASKIGKEWNEQAAAFAKYVTGKTLDQVKGIALDAEGHATAAEITASTTVHVGDFINIIQKAAATAKAAK